MDWVVTNLSKDAITFRIALAPKVAVGHRVESGPVELARGAATLHVDGVDAVIESEDGNILETTVGGRASRRLALTIGSRSPSSR